MKKLFLPVLMLVGFLPPISLAGSDIAWLTFQPMFSYQDITTSCSTDMFGREIYLAMEITDGRATSAVLKTTSLMYRAQVVLETKELAGIELFKDDSDKYWVSRWTLNERILNWVFFHASTSSSKCEPTMDLKTIAPVPYTFQFAGSATLKSGLAKFNGERGDGRPYEIELAFKQKPYVY